MPCFLEKPQSFEKCLFTAMMVPLSSRRQTAKGRLETVANKSCWENTKLL